MDTDQEQTAPEADDTTEQSGTPAQTVRVPNVSPNAKSGLDHTIIGSNALEGAGGYDDDQGEDLADDPDMPKDDLDAALAWLGEAEDSDTARHRADAIWGAYATGDDAETNPANADLATALRKAVYGDAGDSQPDTLLGTVTVPEGLTGEDLDAWVSGDAVEGDETTNPDRWAAYLARKQAADDLAADNDPANAETPAPANADDAPKPS